MNDEKKKPNVRKSFTISAILCVIIGIIAGVLYYVYVEANDNALCVGIIPNLLHISIFEVFSRKVDFS